MHRRKIVIGNWKMNPRTLKEAEKWTAAISKSLTNIRNTDVVICAPFPYLVKLRALSRKISFGAQNAFWGETGPFTGEVSPDMLYDLGARHVILGHSERRVLGETDELVNKKVKSALVAGLTPVICVGEQERDNEHKHFNVVKNQVRACLKGIPRNSFLKIIIAYEPVWAISSTPNRRDATPTDCLEMAIFIRKALADISSATNAVNIRVIYGGSVTDKDAKEFLAHGGVDGVLPGRASLDPEKFVRIIKICEALKS